MITASEQLIRVQRCHSGRGRPAVQRAKGRAQGWPVQEAAGSEWRLNPVFFLLSKWVEQFSTESSGTPLLTPLLSRLTKQGHQLTSRLECNWLGAPGHDLADF